MKSLIIFIGIFLFGLFWQTVTWATSQEQNIAPILRIEVGQHTGVINRLSTDAEQKLLATVSDDKTLRLWNLPEGTLYATLRVPIGENIKGALYAVALSPDAKTVAVAGSTGTDAEKYSIYLFDVEKRQLKGRLANLPAAIYHLSYSKDGSLLAAVFDAGFGLKIWNSQTGKLAAEDPDYADRSTWVDFNSAGELATVAYDGFIRVYDKQLQLRKKVSSSSGKHPYSIKFAADSSLIAVGYADQKKADIYDSDLTKLRTYSADDLTGQQTAIIAWGKQSSLLLSGDIKNSANDYIIRSFNDASQENSAYSDLPSGKNIITDILESRNADLDYLVATADPKWFAVKAKQIQFERKAAIWDARIVELPGKRFALSPDGLAIEFSIAEKTDASHLFRLQDLSLSSMAKNPPQHALTQPVTQSNAINVSNWQRSPQPKLNDKNLLLGDFERSVALAIDPLQKHFLLGTNHYLRWYDQNGVELKKLAINAEVFAVNIATEVELAVAALADGTIRWYSLKAGELLSERLAFFPYDDGKQWIVWTPEGFFAHSDGGGSELAGYHINKGDNKRPEWIAFAQLYQSYYAPELILPKVLGKQKQLQDKLDAIKSIKERLSTLQVPLIKLLELCVVNAQETRGFARLKPSSPVEVSSGWLASHIPESWLHHDWIMRLVNQMDILLARFGNPTEPVQLAQKATSDTSQNQPVAESCFPINGQGQTRGFARVNNSPSAAIYRNQFPQHIPAIKLHYAIENRTGGLGDVDVYANGQIQARPDAINSNSQSGTHEASQVIPLNQGINQIYVQAYEKTGGTAAKSELIQLINPTLERALQQASYKPRLVVIAIGIDQYAPPNQLKYAVKDASDVLQTIQSAKSDSYSSVLPYTLFNEQATLGNIDSKLTEISGILQEEDTVLLYLSGHGLLEGNDYYFLPYDVKNEAISKTAVSKQRLKNYIAQLAKTHKIFMLLDSCHSGSFNLNNIYDEITSFDKLKQQLGENIFILAASGADQEAQDQFLLADGSKPANGLFAWAVVDGLRGMASRQDDKIVDNYNLGSYVQRKIDLLTQKQTLYKQKARFQAVNSGDVTTFDITKAN